MKLGRRGLLFGAPLSLWACSRCDSASRSAAPPPPMTVYSAAPDAATPAPRGAVRMLEWDFEPSRGGPARAVVLVPAWGAPDERFPVLIALHGHGETVKPPREGAMGWPRDYALTRAYGRLAAPPITNEDLEGFGEKEQIKRINEALAARPFGGVIAVCPYMPDLDLEAPDPIRAYGRFLIETLLPRVRAETPAMTGPAATGIDGVSQGGAVALRVAFANPQAFGALGTLQAAVNAAQARELTEAARAARAKNPKLKLRLLTSDGDYFRAALQAVDRAWKENGVEHEYLEVPGPHNYAFNRGPGAVEMLLWHDRVLRA
jgi:hypothetical protein